MVHLHTHTEYSLRDSIIRTNELVERLKELGQSSVAITEHGRNLGSVPIYKALKKENIKYIHGCEIYICDDVSIKDKENKYYHLILLCKNEVGRLNLNKIMSISEHPDNKYVKPRIDFEILKKYSEGLMCLSACMAGEISRFIESDNVEEAIKRAERYSNLFGEDYYLEVQAHTDLQQCIINKKIVEIAKKLNIELVVTCDAHYVKEEDRKYQNKYAFNGAYKEDGESYVDCYIQSEEEVRQKIDYLGREIVDKCILNTHVISDKCNLEIPLSAPIMPDVDIPTGFDTDKDWLLHICKQGFIEKLNIDYENVCLYDKNKYSERILHDEDGNNVGTELFQLSKEEIFEYVDKFDYEIDSLYRMGFIGYILLVYSYANEADRRGIARGSGGGSLVCYVSNITDIDPIEHGLYFERFIDVGALELLEAGTITKNELKIPDIDLDFSGESCSQVLDFLANRYGEDKVASIGRFGTNKTKGTIRDMCKVLGFSLEQEDEIAKSFENYEIEEIDMMLSGDIPVSPKAEDAIKNVKKYKELFEYVRKLNGLPKSFGLHPCGRIVSTKELDYFMPSCYDKTGIRYLQGDMHDVEDLGLVKIDVLGLRTLNQEYDTLDMSREDKSFISSKQDFRDSKVLDIFRTGNTVGIFQMSSFGMKETLKNMNVQGIEDLSIANALYRPGAMAYIDNFCRRRRGEEPFEYLHPDLEDILKNTYGIIVFQEQLIEIGRLAKIKNPDLLRQATAKKKKELMDIVKPELEEKLKLRGWSQEQFDQLWADMLEFSKYSFNKCVSGDTTLWKRGQQKSSRNPSVEEMYNIKNDLDFAKKNNYLPLRSKYLRGGYPNALSMFPDGRVRPNKIVDIQFAGVKDIYRIVTESGRYLDCTLNHKFPTPTGKKKLEELSVGDTIYAIGEYEKVQKNYNLTDGNFEDNLPIKGQRGFQKRPYGVSVSFEGFKLEKIKNESCCEVCGKEFGSSRFEAHHIDGNRKNNSLSNFQWCCVSCHKKKDYALGRTKSYENGISSVEDKIKSIKFLRTDKTYDVTMGSPAHTFVANNGIITSNSHSSAYAIIAYTTAKQKAYYPVEFYAGLLNSYIGESSFVKDTVGEIVADMSYNKVEFNPLKFGRDNRRCNVEDGKINYAICLIRDCNEAMGEGLYEAGKMKFNNFVDLVVYLKSMKILNTRQLNILIRLGYFSEFGNINELTRIAEIVLEYKYGGAKTINLSKVSSEDLKDIIKKYATNVNAKGKELKTHTFFDLMGMLRECEGVIKNLGLSEMLFSNQIEFQQENLGYSSLVTGKEEDRPKLYVKEYYPIFKKATGTMCGCNIICQSVGSGKQSKFVVWNRTLNKNGEIKKGNIILCTGYKKNGEDFELTDYSQIF